MELAPLLNSSDVVVIATPLYWFSFPAQIKAVIGQLNFSESSKMTGKESYLFVSGGAPGEEFYNPIKELFHLIAESMAWENKGVLQAGGLDEAGAIEQAGILEQAKRSPVNT